MNQLDPELAREIHSHHAAGERYILDALDDEPRSSHRARRTQAENARVADMPSTARDNFNHANATNQQNY